MSTAAFFNRMATLMKSQPAARRDAPVLAKLKESASYRARNSIHDGSTRPSRRGSRRRCPSPSQKLTAASNQTGEPGNGWRVPPMTLGRFGTDYGMRAVVALIGLGANLPEDAIYPSAFVDGDGQPLDGANRYVIHFDKGKRPR